VFGTEDKRLKKGLFFCITLVMLGLLDMATALVGLTCFGAVEANPVIAVIASDNLLIFGLVKLIAVSVMGFMFYKGDSAKISGPNFAFGNRLLQFSHSFAFVFLTTVVANNPIVLTGIV